MSGVGFLKRLFGTNNPRPDQPASVPPADSVDIDAAERAYDLELARSEQDRLDDLAQRQLRYANYSWEPPAQGGERRADDGEKAGDNG